MGRPSRACDSCKANRLQCGRETPVCTQCVLHGKICPGYNGKGPQSIIAHESYGTALLSHNWERSRPVSPVHKPLFAVSGCGVNVEGNEIVGYSGLRPALSPPLEERAIPYFLASYVGDPGTGFGHLGYLSTLVRQISPDGPLITILSAAGTAALVPVTGSHALVKSAGRQYGNALRLINSNLRDPTKVLADETLASILLVAFYEILIGGAAISTKAWYRHLSGAMALIHARGFDQLSTDVGLALFAQLETNMLIQCMAKSEPLPPTIRRLRKASLRYHLSPKRSEQCKLHDLVGDLCALRAMALVEENRQKVIDACLDYESQLNHWVLGLLPCMEYKTVSNVAADDVCESYYFVYQSNYSAWDWNTYRNARTMNAELLISTLRPIVSQANPDPQLMLLYRQSIGVLQQMISESFATIPFHMGFHIKTQSKPRPVSGVLCMTPLYTAAVRDYCPPTFRQWATRRLEYIGTHLGFELAANLAGALKLRASQLENQGVDHSQAQRFEADVIEGIFGQAGEDMRGRIIAVEEGPEKFFDGGHLAYLQSSQENLSELSAMEMDVS